MKLSVIIPYYNTKKYCENLIKKLVFQKNTYYPETEIILVDGASTEDTSWLKQFKDDITIVRNKTNKGVSYARNTGLKKATGDYIQFVDSDDDVSSDFLHIIYTNIRKGYDYVIYRWDCDGKVTEGEIPEDSIKFNWAVWGYTFTRKIIGNEKFNEKMNTMEDYDWLQRVLKPEQKRGVVDTPIYYYNAHNENSICHLIKAGKMEKYRK